VERYTLMAVVPTLTALLLTSLNGLQFFFVILYALLEFSCATHYWKISIYCGRYNSCFLDLCFRKFAAAVDFPCSGSGLGVGEGDVIFSKMPHGLGLW